MSRLIYAAAAWRGYASSAESNNTQAFLIKAKRWGLISEDINFDDIMNELGCFRERNIEATFSTSASQLVHYGLA